MGVDKTSFGGVKKYLFPKEKTACECKRIRKSFFIAVSKPQNFLSQSYGLPAP